MNVVFNILSTKYLIFFVSMSNDGILFYFERIIREFNYLMHEKSIKH